MGQQLHTGRSGGVKNIWLSRLIDAMEEASRAKAHLVPIDQLLLAAVHAQLSRPASACTAYSSAFSLRN
jgi:hypothetical protein